MGFSHIQESPFTCVQANRYLSLDSPPPREPEEFFVLARRVEELLEKGHNSEHQLNEIRATILVNFGTTGPQRHLCNVGDGTGMSTFNLFFHVLEKLTQGRLCETEKEKT